MSLLKTEALSSASYIINDNATISVNTDVKITINSNSANITLSDATTIGTIVFFVPVYDGAVISYKNSSGTSSTFTTTSFQLIRFIWNGTGYILEKTIEISGTDDSGTAFSYQVVERE